MNAAAILLDGLVSGIALAAVALAFSVVYLPTRIFHVSLGAIFAAAPFVYAQLRAFHVPSAVCALAAVAAAMIVSVLVERWNHAPLARQGHADTTHFITSLGLFIVLTQAVVIGWDEQGRFLRQGVDRLWVVPVLGGAIDRARATLGLASAALVGIFVVLLYGTSIGLRFRALAQNPVESALRGLDITRIRQQAFAVSGVLAGSASLLYAMDRGYDAYLGFDIVLLAVVAVIIGGRESFLGPVVGAFILGVAREGTQSYLSARWMDAISFLLLAVFIVVRPLGLIGRKTRAEEELA